MLTHAVLRRTCLAVVDMNGDDALLGLVGLHLDDDEVWREFGWASAGSLGQGQMGDTGYLYGRHPGRTEVGIVSRGRTVRVPVGESGWWLHLEEFRPDEPLPWIADPPWRDPGSGKGPGTVRIAG